MNSNKMDFIVCYNNEIYFRECIDYISWLKVPDGMETEVIGIRDADSMAAGYNAAMLSSDSKYKVYIHQDVLIRNEDFIQDVIAVFRDNQEYGMLGVLGCDTICMDARYRENWNVGGTLMDNGLNSVEIKGENPGCLKAVTAIDGMIMITQYDVKWREDLFDGFHFYDISQSIEFAKAGYKVGVVHQEDYWCNHICGMFVPGNYNMYRRLFCREYAELGYKYVAYAADEEYDIRNRAIAEKMSLITEALKERNLTRITALLTAIINSMGYLNNEICNLYILCRILQLETQNGIKNGFCNGDISYDTLSQKLVLYKLLMKRIEQNRPVDSLKEILEMIASCDPLNLETEKIIIEHSVSLCRRTFWNLKRMLERECGKNMEKAFYDTPFCMPDGSRYGELLNLLKNIKRTLAYLEQSVGNIDEKQCRSAVVDIFNAIEYIYSDMHIGNIGEKMYVAYSDAVENKEDTPLFIMYCREWADTVTDYITDKEKEPLVSVLVCVYNGENIIEDTLRSVMNQSYKNLQIIVVDDASADRSREVIDRLAAEDGRIETIYLQENSNVCKACNIGYAAAHGKYVALIGHDDIWKEEKLQKQVAFMEMNKEYAACFTLVDIIDDNKEICNQQKPDMYAVFDKRNRTQKEWLQQLVSDGNYLCAPSAVIRKEIIGKELYRYGLLQLQDYALWLELLSEYPLYIMQERLTLYRYFLKKKSNLSEINSSSANRILHELHYVKYNYITKLSDEKFRCFFSDMFLKKDAATEAELKCERAFMMKNLNYIYCIEMFIDLLDREDVREILEKDYNFKLKDFYELNSQMFLCDYEIINRLDEANKMIENCRVIIERQQKIIEGDK